MTRRRLTDWDARDYACWFKFPLNCDFHTLTSTQVENVLSAADHHQYRKPKNANGSRARCFHDFLRRTVGI